MNLFLSCQARRALYITSRVSSRREVADNGGMRGEAIHYKRINFSCVVIALYISCLSFGSISVVLGSSLTTRLISKHACTPFIRSLSLAPRDAANFVNAAGETCLLGCCSQSRRDYPESPWIEWGRHCRHSLMSSQGFPWANTHIQSCLFTWTHTHTLGHTHPWLDTTEWYDLQAPVSFLVQITVRNL